MCRTDGLDGVIEGSQDFTLGPKLFPLISHHFGDFFELFKFFLTLKLNWPESMKKVQIRNFMSSHCHVMELTKCHWYFNIFQWACFFFGHLVESHVGFFVTGAHF